MCGLIDRQTLIKDKGDTVYDKIFAGDNMPDCTC